MSGWVRLCLAVVFGLVAIGMAPLTAVYFRNLWSQAHYQFFPVLIAAVVLLLISRWKLERFTVVAAPVGNGAFSRSHGVKSPLWPRLRPLVALVIVGLGIAIEFAAIWAFPTITPWGGYLGLLIAGFGVVMYVGQGLPKSLLPVWALMALILMPPENADDPL